MPTALRALLVCCTLLFCSMAGIASADAATPRPLGCALRETIPNLPARTLCEELGRALKRPVFMIDDARRSDSEAVEIMRDDVQWTLVLVRERTVHSWTRVSISDAQSHEADVFARVLRVLLRTSPKQPESCVRVVGKGDRSERNLDVIYPWAELKPCARRSVEVLDPWWK